MLRDGMHYLRKNDLVVCNLCPHNCKLEEGRTGVCGVRRMKDGRLETINYGEVSSIALDPIEKKPLYHFKPGSNILSLGSFGCNFSCQFCQNYSISMERPQTKYMTPEELVKLAAQYKSRGNIGVAFTYNEPSIWYEYIHDFGEALKYSKEDMDIVMVTNGYIGIEALREILPYISAMNIDLKAFTEKFYKNVCGGSMKHVLSTIEEASKKCHVEITTLVIDDHNSSFIEIEELSSWLGGVDRGIPLHLSRYHPSYKFNAPETDSEAILKLREAAGKYLDFVYVGNLPGKENNTLCPECGKLLIERSGYSVEKHIDKDFCPRCQRHINIVL